MLPVKIALSEGLQLNSVGQRINSYKITLVLEAIALAIIIFIAGYLRLNNILVNPGWYTDETTHIDIAQNLLSGRIQYLAVTDSTLLFARFPLFQSTLAGTMALLGEGIIALRTLTGGLGVLSALTLYIIVRRTTHNPALALAGALSLAIYPTAVIYSRIGFSYALLAPMVLLTVGGLTHYITNNKRTGLVVASLVVGLGVTSDLMMATLAPVIGLVVLWHRWRDLFWCVPLVATPFGIYIATMLITNPDVFLYDFPWIISRLSTMTLPEQIDNVILNYETILTENLWITLGIIGLFMLRHRQLKIIALLCFFIPVASLGRTVALFHLSFYYMIPLLPIPMIGLGALLIYGSQHIHNAVQEINIPFAYPYMLKPIAGAALAFLIIWMPLAASLNRTASETTEGFSTSIDAFLTNAEAATDIAEFINANTSSNDLVIGSVPYLWMLDTRVSDYQISAAWDGLETPHLPLDIPRERFAFDPSFDQAKYVIVDNLWRFWGNVHVEGLTDLYAKLGPEWPLVYQSQDVQVYQNPDYRGGNILNGVLERAMSRHQNPAP